MAASDAGQAIPRLKRPEILPLVLRELDTVRALGIADIAAARLDVKEATHADEAPGQRFALASSSASRSANFKCRVVALSP